MLHLIVCAILFSVPSATIANKASPERFSAGSSTRTHFTADVLCLTPVYVTYCPYNNTDFCNVITFLAQISAPSSALTSQYVQQATQAKFPNSFNSLAFYPKNTQVLENLNITAYKTLTFQTLRDHSKHHQMHCVVSFTEENQGIWTFSVYMRPNYIYSTKCTKHLVVWSGTSFRCLVWLLLFGNCAVQI